jgi:hypothetical protein
VYRDGLLIFQFLSLQLFQQRFGFFQIMGIKPFRKPTVNLGKTLMSLPDFPLLLPQARQAHHRPQLEGFGMLALGDVNG